jgi:hypothetical protein
MTTNDILWTGRGMLLITLAFTLIRIRVRLSTEDLGSTLLSAWCLFDVMAIGPLLLVAWADYRRGVAWGVVTCLIAAGWCLRGVLELLRPWARRTFWSWFWET